LREKEKERNDAQFDTKAYKLAEKIDLAYLVGTFDPANHLKGKDIVLDELDEAQAAFDAKKQQLTQAVERHQHLLEGAGGYKVAAATATAALDARTDLTAGEKARRSKEFAQYMKKLYHDEMDATMNQLLDRLPIALSKKVRKALAAKQHRLRMKKRLAYIRRKRKAERVSEEEVEYLTRFHAAQPPVRYDSSSSDDDNNETDAARKARLLVRNFVVAR
jgi:hypothetical protein